MRGGDRSCSYKNIVQVYAGNYVEPNLIPAVRGVLDTQPRAFRKAVEAAFAFGGFGAAAVLLTARAQDELTARRRALEDAKRRCGCSGCEPL